MTCTCRVYVDGSFEPLEGHHTYYDYLTATGDGGGGGRLLDLDKLRAMLDGLIRRGDDVNGGGHFVAVRCCCGWTTGYARRLGRRHIEVPASRDVSSILEAVAAHVADEPADLLDLLALEVQT